MSVVVGEANIRGPSSAPASVASSSAPVFWSFHEAKAQISGPHMNNAIAIAGLIGYRRQVLTVQRYIAVIHCSTFVVVN